MATTINVKAQRPDSKTIAKTITGVNPNVSDAQIQEFTNEFYNLSDNELVNVQRVEKTDIDLD